MGTVEAVSRAKALVRRCAAEVYARTPGFLHQLEGKVVILMYHRVVTDTELANQFIQPGMYVTAGTFERQVRFLREHFDVLSLDELLLMWQEKTWNSARRYCVVTFDDGWLDNYVHAFPILREHDVPATIFLPTGYIGTTKWFWPEQVGWLGQRFSLASPERQSRILASLGRRFHEFDDIARAMQEERWEDVIERCKPFKHERIGELVGRLTEELEVQLPEERLVMNWEELREMSAAKVSFGSHSVNHKILMNLPDSELTEEVCESMRSLREHSLKAVPVFCYPNGAHSPAAVRSVEAAGYRAATTTEPGWEDRYTSDMFRLKRVGVHNDLTDTDSLFAFHLAGYNNLFSS